MKIKGNLLIFSSDNEDRTDVRKLKEKRLQVLLDEKNDLPSFEINNTEYAKKSAENEVEKLFEISNFYIEQLYTWADPKHYTNSEEIIITYLVVINKNDINNMPNNLCFYDLNIKNIENSQIQEVYLSNKEKKIKYDIETISKRRRNNIEYTNKLVGKSEVKELTAIIIHTGVKRLRNRIENTNIAFCFLDREFTISELQQVYEIIMDKKLVSANFRKKIEPMVRKTDIVVKESAYRPSNKYIFNDEFVKNWV